MQNSDKFKVLLSYWGILVLVPLLAMKDDDFAQFHAKQGLNLFIIEVIGYIAIGIIGGIVLLIGRGIFGTGAIYGLFLILANLLRLAFSLACLALIIIGCMNVWNEKREELPIVGQFKIVK